MRAARNGSARGRELAEELLDAPPEVRRVYRREAVELRLDLVERGPEAIELREPSLRHHARIFEVLLVAALQLRERLRIEIEVLEG